MCVKSAELWPVLQKQEAHIKYDAVTGVQQTWQGPQKQQARIVCESMTGASHAQESA